MTPGSMRLTGLEVSLSGHLVVLARVLAVREAAHPLCLSRLQVPVVQSTFPSTSHDLSMNLMWMNMVEVASLTFLALPVTWNSASPRLDPALTFQPSRTLWEPIVNALPGVTSRGALRSSSAC
jgi:hypothetical protein